MRIVKDFLLILLTLVVAYLVAAPVVRFYDRFYSVEYGGAIALLLGFIISSFFLVGLLYGLFYKDWYKRFLAILVLPIIYIVIQGFLNFFKDALLLIVLSLIGYLLGFGIRKLTDHFRAE